jgi:membrane protein implicated in regulation of membrane protease activity
MLIFLILDTATLIGILVLNFTKLLLKEPILFWFNISFVALSAILFLFSYFAFREVVKEREQVKDELSKLKQEQQLKQTEVVRELIIGAKVNHISTYDYYAKAFGQTEFINGKQIIVDVTLFPLKQIKIDSIEIDLFGKPYKAKEPSSMILKDSQSYKFSFDIPDNEAINTNEAVIRALSANTTYPSNPFEVKFMEAKNDTK